jgi:hypothetical protein
MSSKISSDRIHYFDVTAGMIFLAIAAASLSIAARESWPWGYNDSLGSGLFLFAMTTFILLRKRAYAQRIPWVLLGFSILAVAGMVLLFRRWAIPWVAGGVVVLLFGLVMRSKTVPAKAVFGNALLITGSILVTLILIEGALRLAPSLLPEGARLRLHYQGTGEPWHVPHPYIGHLLIADAKARAMTARAGVASASIDIWGFRNKWPWPEQAEIVAVGDSFAYSQMVDDEQAWTALLDQALPQSRVVNLGLIGGAPQQYLRIYETFGIDLAPKVLLVGLFLGNDLDGAHNFDLWWRAGGKGSFPDFRRPEAKPGVRGWVAGQLKRSHLVAFLRELHVSYQSGRFLGGKTMELADGSRLQLVPRALTQAARQGQPGRPEFASVLDTLERTHILAKQHNTHCLVLFFPSKEQVYLPLLGEEAPDLAAPLIPELDKRGIAYLNLGPPFRERAAAGETLFWELDGHYNAPGYALVAEVVRAHLKDNAEQYGLKD